MQEPSQDQRLSAWVARLAADGRASVRLEALSEDDLPPGDVLIEVHHSSVNYKDALALTGRGKVVRRHPMILGIDLAGVVRSVGPSSVIAGTNPGDVVLATGMGLGETIWGGYAGLARVPAELVIPVPPPLDSRRSMGLGTAGLTAMLSVMALERHGLRPGEREVAVTGATGGVGSFAVALLSRLGFQVAAVTGKPDAHEILRALGATRIVDRSELEAPAPALGSERWAGAIDTLGGAPLASLLAHTAYGGAVTACGMAAGADLHTAVFPLILRNVALLGVSSVRPSRDLRLEAWRRLAQLLPADLIDRVAHTVVPLAGVPEVAQRLIDGGARGRVVVDVRA